MSDQNFNNHTRYVPAYHFVTGTAILVGLVGSIINLVHSAPENRYSASLLILLFLLLLSFFWFARAFALRAQDRAIRAEESLRTFLLTGKPMDPRLRMSQVIALRFASDEELPALAKKAAEQNLGNRAIKMEIKKWRADHHRV
jgi:hypothetical protein